MTIEIHQPRLKALIQQRMASGHFQTIEDLLLQILEPSQNPASKPSRQNLTEVFEPIRGWLTDEEVDTLFRRDPSSGRIVDLA